MANFDPYHDWLGIPAGSRPVHHYLLLGLKLFQSEPPIIAEAADERLAKLKAHLQGPNAAEAQRLIAEVTAARATLIAAASRKAYEAALRQQLGMAPAADGPPVAAAPAAPRPKQPPAPAPAAPVASAPPAAAAVPRVVPGAVPVAPAAVPVAPMAAPVGQAPFAAGMPQVGIPQASVPGFGYPAAPVAGYGAPHGGAPMGGPPFGSQPQDPTQIGNMGIRPRRVRRSSNNSMAIVAVTLAVIVTAGAMCFAFRKQIMAGLEGKPAEVVVEEEPAEVGYEQPRKRYADLIDQQRSANGQATSDPTPPTDDLANRMAAGVSSQTPSMEPAPEQKPAEPAPPKAEPKPSGMTVSIKPVSPEEQAAVAKSIAAARTALGERNLGKADEQLNLAMLEASSADSLTAIDSARALQESLAQFWKAVRERVKGLKAGDELEIDGKPMNVIAADEEHLSVRTDGQVRDYLIEKLPTNIAYFLAKASLSATDVESRVVLGAFQVTDPKGNHDEGRQLLDQAAAEGSETAKTLLKVLGNGV